MNRLMKIVAPRRQRGFTLIELSIVALILLVLAVVGVPSIQSLLIENRAPAAARDLQSAAVKIRQVRAANGAIATPYTGIAIAELGSMLRGSSYEVTPAAPAAATAIAHSIGSGDATPSVTIAAGTLAIAGDSFTVSLADVARAACASFASTFARQAEVIAITPAGGGSAATVKAAGGTFSAQAAQTTCADSNTIALTFR
jgi:prepilin-type N-terminal cleavage/methylation domain-containing protein